MPVKMNIIMKMEVKMKCGRTSVTSRLKTQNECQNVTIFELLYERKQNLTIPWEGTFGPI